MTPEELRDTFAAAALQGLLANPNCETDFRGFAMNAYAYADAMLLARSANAPASKPQEKKGVGQ